MQHTRGFTLIEILVVTVVIAILASVTVVGYNNAQGHAAASRASEAVSAYAKVFKMYYQDKGDYPLSTGVYGYGDICLGSPSDFPAVSGSYNAGDCLYNATANSAAGGDGHYRVAAWQPFMDDIKPYASSVINSNLTPTRMMSESWRGIRYTRTSNTNATLEWILNGNHKDWCTPGTGSSGSVDSLGSVDSTWCTYNLAP